MNRDKDTGNISKDGMTGLNSKAYFLVSLEQSINELSLPNAAQNTGLVAVFLRNVPQETVVSVAELVDKQTDYATHYKLGNDDVIAGVYVSAKTDVSQTLHAQLTARFPKARLGIACKTISADNDAEKVLDSVAQDAYDAMLLQPAP
ncbi:MAG: hypothetical protein QW165_00060 [Candidatus Woesearchaeota archaeon]